MKSLFIAVISISILLCSCSKEPPSFDKLKLVGGESGIVPFTAAKTIPDPGQIVVERSGTRVEAFTRVELDCPEHASNIITGTEYRPDKIILCFDLMIDPPGEETSLYGSCPQDFLIKYQIHNFPKNVEPKFEVGGSCLNKESRG